jgi:hypothetical protein
MGYGGDNDKRSQWSTGSIDSGDKSKEKMKNDSAEADGDLCDPIQSDLLWCVMLKVLKRSVPLEACPQNNDDGQTFYEGKHHGHKFCFGRK